MSPWLPVSLALSDIRSERRFFAFCSIGLAAVLAPLLVLLALKHGVIESLLQRLLDNPVNREIKVAINGNYGADFIAELAARPDVAFVVPQVRSLSAEVKLVNLQASPQRISPASLLPTAPGDPLLPPDLALPPDGIALSRDLAVELDRKTGDQVRIIVDRRRDGREERVTLDLTVLAVGERTGFSGRFALLPAALLEAFEDYRDDVAVPAFGWEGTRAPVAEGARRYAKFRLYAKQLEQVESLADFLTTRGIQVVTQAAAIHQVQEMNESLSRIFLIIAVLAGAGYLVSLGVSLWSNVERKQRSLSVLRLVGLPRWGLALFPMVHAALVAVAGVLLAILLYLAAATAINLVFAEGLMQGERLARLEPYHYLSAAAVTLVVALLAALHAARGAARVDPAEGMREV